MFASLLDATFPKVCSNFNSFFSRNPSHAQRRGGKDALGIEVAVDVDEAPQPDVQGHAVDPGLGIRHRGDIVTPMTTHTILHDTHGNT